MNIEIILDVCVGLFVYDVILAILKILKDKLNK